MGKYILGIDQSTSGTKAVLFNEKAELVCRRDCPHEQIISKQGWVSHNPDEIFEALKRAVAEATSEIDTNEIEAIAISNQRETAMIWDRDTGKPVDNAVVWQCGRAEDICTGLESHSQLIKDKTGLPLSPYFSGAKISWLLKNNDTHGKNLCAGTMDSWLIYKLTGDFKTDYSNASRTQLFNLETLKWDEEICALFGIDTSLLAEVCDSNAGFGLTDVSGILKKPVPIYGVMGDSHGALYGQGCTKVSMTKATYGTGSSVMMNIGEGYKKSQNGLVTSLAWGIDGRVTYVLEGNINYTGAVTKWLVEDVGLISSSREAGEIARSADREDTTYLVPAFTGLGAPHWKSDARAILCGMSRSTGKAEIVKAAEECIAYQITDVVRCMEKEIGESLSELCVDGGPTRDEFLMQFQSDILNSVVSVPHIEELSVAGVAFLAGQKCGLYAAGASLPRTNYIPSMDEQEREKRYSGWQKAVALL